jgi:glycosyltransferase involved in cell wall biosynthesis
MTTQHIIGHSLGAHPVSSGPTASSGLFPLISCIMPTRNRRDFLARAITLFEAQDYPNKELIIVEDGDECNRDLAGKQHLYLYLSTQQASIGIKRNWAASLAHGSLLCHWDDDDYYGSQRLSQQAWPILEDRADVTAYRMTHLLDMAGGLLWECDEAVHRKLFPHNVRAATLLYRYRYWEDGPGYAPLMAGEDALFLQALLERGARLTGLADPAGYICVRHGRNQTADIDGRGSAGWRPVPLEQYFSARDLAFYRLRFANAGRAVV